VDQEMVRQKEEREELAGSELQLDPIDTVHVKDIEKVVTVDQFEQNEPCVMAMTTRDLKTCPECSVELITKGYHYGYQLQSL
jgi:hypothetical protein